MLCIALCKSRISVVFSMYQSNAIVSNRFKMMCAGIEKNGIVRLVYNTRIIMLLKCNTVLKMMETVFLHQIARWTEYQKIFLERISTVI